MIFAGLSRIRANPGQRQSTLAAIGAALGVAVAGAVVWGLLALLIHKQLSLIGLLIGAGVGAMVARFRPGHLPTIIAGAVIAVAGCALGTLLGIVFISLNAQTPLSVILGNPGILFRALPREVGALGVLFYALAAYAAIRVPLQSHRRSAQMTSAQGHYGGGPAASGPGVIGPAAMTGPSPAPAQPAADTPPAAAPPQ